MLLTIVTANGNQADVDFDPDCDLNDFRNVTQLVQAMQEAVAIAKEKDGDPDYEEPDDDPGADLAEEIIARQHGIREPFPGDDPPM